jgi:hypothetical protein
MLTLCLDDQDNARIQYSVQREHPAVLVKAELKHHQYAGPDLE